MLEKKILVISCDPQRYIANSEGKIENIYIKNTNNKFIRALRKISLKNSLFGAFWLNNWYSKLSEYSKLIIFDTGNAGYIINLVKKKNPEIDIVLWYWNPVCRTINPKKINRNHCTIWSYNPADCDKYAFLHNSQFYIKSNLNKENTALKQDVYFLGADKNRQIVLIEMKSIFEYFGIKYKFVLIKTKKSKNGKIPFSKPISPNDNIQNIFASKAIIDVVDKKDSVGVTLRSFEAAMFKKKLITNDPNVRNLKFYNPKNVFIWGEDDIKNLSSFINSPYDVSLQKNLEYYEFDNWLCRFER